MCRVLDLIRISSMHATAKTTIVFFLLTTIDVCEPSDSSSVEVVSWTDVEPNRTPVEGPQPLRNPMQTGVTPMMGVHLPGCGPDSEPILPNPNGFKSAREMKMQLRAILNRPGVASYLRDRKKHLGIDVENIHSGRHSDDKGTEETEGDQSDEQEGPLRSELSADESRENAVSKSAQTHNESAGSLPSAAAAVGNSNGTSEGASGQMTDDRRDCGSDSLRDIDSELWAGCDAGDAAAVRRALRAGASVRARDARSGNCTALHRAAVAGAESVVHVLRRAGASAVARDADGDTPLHVAAAHGHTGQRPRGPPWRRPAPQPAVPPPRRRSGLPRRRAAALPRWVYVRSPAALDSCDADAWARRCAIRAAPAGPEG